MREYVYTIFDDIKLERFYANMCNGNGYCIICDMACAKCSSGFVRFSKTNKI